MSRKPLCEDQTHPPCYDRTILAATLSRLVNGSQHLTPLHVLSAPDGVKFNRSRVWAYGWLDANRPQFRSYHRSRTLCVLLVLNHWWLPVDPSQISFGI